MPVTPYSKEAAHAEALALFEAVAEKNPDRTARGQAMLARAWQAGDKFELAEYEKRPNADTLAKEAEKALETVAKDYNECLRLVEGSKQTLGDIAKRELFGLRNLRLGKVAPEIEAEDLDGVKFKLSGSRGKITVLVFWATWCGPCMQMVPHERKLVARLKDQPFVLIGVNGDDDRAQAKKATVKEKMNWRSFWNGPEGSAQLISDTWNLHGWPTVYVLDAKGVIRFKDVREQSLDKAVDELLAEMKNSK